MRKIINRLTLVYYGFYLLAIALAACGYRFLAGSQTLIDAQSSAGIALSSAYIVLLVASIPLALKLFNIKVKKLAAVTDAEAKEQAYMRLSVWRLVVIGANLLIGITLFYLMGSQSMIFCAAIAAIALVFCKPGEVRAERELAAPDDPTTRADR